MVPSLFLGVHLPRKTWYLNRQKVERHSLCSNSNLTYRAHLKHFLPHLLASLVVKVYPVLYHITHMQLSLATVHLSTVTNYVYKCSIINALLQHCSFSLIDIDCITFTNLSWKCTHPVNMGIPGFPFLRDYRNPLQYGNGWWHRWRIRFWWIQSVSGKEWPSVKWPIQVVQSCTWTDGRFVIEREGQRIVKSCTLTECFKTSKWNYDKLTEQRKGIIASILNASVYFLT